MTGKTNSANKKIELEEITVNPGASDVVRIAEDGKGFSKVTVPGDTDLIPVNIREGIDIFGKIGTLKEGVPLTGILGMQKIAVDYFTPAADTYLSSLTLAHSLGTIPTTVFIMPVAEGYTLPETYNSYYILYHAFNSAKFVSGSTKWASIREAIYGAGVNFTITNGSYSPAVITNTQFKADTNSGTGNSYLKAGVEYAIITAA